MKLIRYKINDSTFFGHLTSDKKIYSLNHMGADTIEIINTYMVNQTLPKLHESEHKFEDTELLNPLPNPNSLRDAYAFKNHVTASRKNRGLNMIPEYDEFPIYYYSNHNSVFGPGNLYFHQNYFKKLDFELELAVVIGKKGIDINAKDADDYIFGFMIMNDLSERDIQVKEMKLNLGPAKGKDVATTFGPLLVSMNEIKDFITPSDEGNIYNLEMTASLNGVEISKDNSSNMSWTFAQIIERISQGTTLYPGDVIGSGTCGTGCFLELNGKVDKPRWLQPNDVIELTIDELGTLNNYIKIK